MSDGGPPPDESPFDGPVALPLDGVLDLHAFDPREVGELVPGWLEESHAAGLTALRLVHGKGTGALRRSVEALLSRHPLVAAHRPADEAGGGWGATLITLREAPPGAAAGPGQEVKRTFDAAAARYDALRRQLIPCFDGFYGMAAALLPFGPGQPARILDLGAGTGLLAEAVRRRLPAARLTLLDFSEAMLAHARARFQGAAVPVEIRVGDSTRAPLGGPWDAIVSALSIHHHPDHEKRRLFGRAFEALAPGGIFVDADNVLADDPAVQARDRAAWIAAIRESGLAEAEVEAALERTTVDRLSPLGTQLGWLRRLGFVEVDCAFKWRHFAVFSGRRPA